MTSQEEQIAIAVAALSRLKLMHDQFASKVASMPNTTVNGGSFTTDGTDFAATALSISFRVERRPIIVDGFFMASEYAFIAQHEGNDLCLWRMYLDGHGVLFTDPALSNRLCDITNTHLPTKVVAALASGLMASPIFTPRNGG